MSEKLNRPTLLVISDNPSIRHWIKRNLENQFYIIESADRSSAIEAVQTIGLDFIILDSHLEECDPLNLSSDLRRINMTTPILLITGRLKKSFRKEAMNAGITDFLGDQLAIEELNMRIAAAQKTAQSRTKTSDLSSNIKRIARPPAEDHLKNSSLKEGDSSSS
ncbi:MAG: two component transcriptional regulator [Parachlamydiales bacterium]|nr:two component transcriptional regulator [Parachlamydiales bacterium]